jgi:RNA polymerase sigma factor (sigma-70 family)
MSTAPLDRVAEFLRRTTAPPQADAELLARCAARDEAAFTALVRRHGPSALAVCRGVLGDTPDADDAFQAAVFVLWRDADRIRRGPAVGAWLCGVAHRIACRLRLDESRRRRREGRTARPADASSLAPDLSWREACGVLHEELDRLPDRYRLPLMLCYLEGKSRDETARLLGWSMGAVRGQLERGRHRLRRRLIRRGVDLSAGLLAALASESRAGAVVPPTLFRTAIETVAGGTSPAIAALVRGAAVVTYARFAAVLTFVGLAAAGAGTWSHYAAAGKPAAIVAAPAADPPAPVEETLEISGRVLDPDGKPFAGATLYALRPKPEKPQSDENLEAVVQGVTGADGRFRFAVPKDQLGTGPGGDPWPVMAAAEGFGLGWTATSKDGQEVTVRLVKDQPLDGRILDSEGRPVANAQVRVMGLFGSQTESLDGFLTGWKAAWKEAIWRHLDKRTMAPPQAVRVSSTDRDGRFRIIGAGVERLIWLEIKGPTVAQSSAYVVTRTGFDPKPFNEVAERSMAGMRRRPDDVTRLYGPTFDFVAAPSKTITGVVRDAAGKPVAGAHVGSIVGPNNVVSTTTDAEGRFTLAGFQKRPTYLLRVSPEKTSSLLARTIEVPDTEGFQPATADILLARGVVIIGQVIDKQTGKGIQSGVRVAPLPENQFFGKPGYDSYKHDRTMATTDPDGRFQLTIIPGASVLMAQGQGGESLDGQYLKPYLNARIDEEDRKQVKVSTDGTFATAGGSMETLDIDQAVKRVDLAENAGPTTVELHLIRGKMAKLIVQDPDGQLLSGAIVSGVTAAWPIAYALKSAECPIYALEPEKPRTLVIYHVGRKLGGHVVIRGDETGPVTVKLQPLGTVTGRILDADGQPIAGADVQPSFSSNSASELERFLRQQRPALITDATGRFRLEGIVPEQKFTLSVRKDRAFLGPDPQLRPKEAAIGATLDFGDVRTKPRGD